MDSLQHIVNKLEQKISELVVHCSNLKARNQSLREENLLLKEDIRMKKELIQEMEEKINLQGGVPFPKEDDLDTRLKIKLLVSEIDQCISFIKEQSHVRAE